MSASGKPSLVIGLGEIGKPLFELLQRAEPTARGIDIQPAEVAPGIGIMHLCYPHAVAAGFVATAVHYAQRFRPELIVVHSTVQPGTTRELERQSGVPAVYSPVRGKHTRMRDDLLRYRKFVAGSNPEAV